MNQDHEDIWHVQLPTGELRLLTLDQLDAAFQVGMIDEGCYVRRDGAMKWRTLAEELAAEAEPAPQPQPQPAPRPAIAPVVSYPPIYSTAPMVSSLDDDEIPASLRGGSKTKKVVGVLGGLAAVAALAVFGVTKLGASHDAAAAGAAVTQPSAPLATAPANPAPAAQAPTLSEAQKKALADMDQTNERKAEQRRRSRIESAVKTSKPYKSEKPFTKGGSKYDPLNAKL